jgi:peptide/nickel transport system substrate-binding protein
VSGIRAFGRVIACVILVGWEVAAGCGVGNAQDPRPTELRVGVANEPDSIDPHFHDYGGNLSLSLQIFEPLVRMDAGGKLTAGLATDWKATDDHSWVFHLRSGVTFQNGDKLTPEDVIFTLRRAGNVPNSPAGFGANVRPIADVTAVDAHTLVIDTKGPAPLLPNFLAEIGIVSHEVGAAASTADYNSGQAVIGTGPYRFESWRRGDRIVLLRNDTYWGPRPVWDRVTLHFIPNAAARAAALLAGDVDLIDGVSVEDVALIRRNAAFGVRSAVSANVIAFEPDVADRKPPFITGPDGEKLDHNPLADKRVREAIQLAINRDGLKRQIMNDQAEVANQIMLPGQFGYDPSIATPAYDPARAKALLAEAGYGHGLRATLDCQADRYANGAAICQAVAQMLTRIGVRTDPVAMPHAVFIGHANRHEYSLFTAFIQVRSGEPSAPLAATFATPGPERDWGVFNRSQYSDKTFDALLEAAQTEIDPIRRETTLRQATRRLMDTVAFFPLLHPLNIEAMRAGLDHTPRADGFVFAADVSKPQ